MTFPSSGLDATSNCRACGSAVPPRKPGQERFYCSAVCRRRAEYVQRRLDRLASQVDRLEVDRNELYARRPSTHAANYSYWRGKVTYLTGRIAAHQRQMDAVRAELAGERQLQEVPA